MGVAPGSGSGRNGEESATDCWSANAVTVSRTSMRFSWSRNYSRGPMRNGHDGQHRIDAGNTGESTRVGDVQASYTQDAVFGIHDRRLGARAHAAGRHLMEGDEQQLVRAPARRVDPRQPVLASASAAGPVVDGASERQPDLACARGLEQLRPSGDGAPQMRAVVAREAIIDDRGAVAIHADLPPPKTVSRSEERRVGKECF